MELNQENIEKVVEVLRMGKFNEVMKDVQNYFEYAKELIEKNPDLTPEEIGQNLEELLLGKDDKEQGRE